MDLDQQMLNYLCRFYDLLDDVIDSYSKKNVYTSFAAYRFAIKGRLNLLPVKTVVRRAGKSISTICTKCKAQPESLGHVLNACTPNAGLMRARHNQVLERLVKAIPKEGMELYVEQAISPDNLRPDILLHDPSTGG
jgi:hypothetical protein